jgi:hypothetical protein
VRDLKLGINSHQWHVHAHDPRISEQVDEVLPADKE